MSNKINYYRTPEAHVYYMVTPAKTIKVTAHPTKAAIQSYEKVPFNRIAAGQTLLRVRHADFKAKQQEAAQRMLAYHREVLEEQLDHS